MLFLVSPGPLYLGGLGCGAQGADCHLTLHPALQPEELTNALEISNIVFTSLFALEMLLKLLVYGPFGYIKNPYNIFDGVIVVIRCATASCVKARVGMGGEAGIMRLVAPSPGILPGTPMLHTAFSLLAPPGLTSSSPRLGG